jgi:colicin import membrane protein
MSRTPRYKSTCLNLPQEHCTGVCEYIVTRKGKAKQYCRKKTVRETARERGRRAVQHAKLILQQRVEQAARDEAEARAKYAIAQERARNISKRAFKQAEHLRRLERERILQQRKKAEIVSDRGRNAAEQARVQLLANRLAEEHTVTKQQLSYERARNAAERERAIQINKERQELLRAYKIAI